MSSPPPVVRTAELGGRRWTIREVPLPSFTAENAFALVFDCGLEQRAVSPAPAGWAFWDEPRLQAAWQEARLLRPAGPPPPRA